MIVHLTTLFVSKNVFCIYSIYEKSPPQSLRGNAYLCLMLYLFVIKIDWIIIIVSCMFVCLRRRECWILRRPFVPCSSAAWCGKTISESFRVNEQFDMCLFCHRLHPSSSSSSSDCRQGWSEWHSAPQDKKTRMHHEHVWIDTPPDTRLLNPLQIFIAISVDVIAHRLPPIFSHKRTHQASHKHIHSDTNCRRAGEEKM